MAKWARPGVLFAALVLLWPTAAHAQASLAGVVKDASGGVLPGVTVEAASSALIEKVRSVVTDDTGQYRIVDLRPGSYSVTFTLTGFSTVKREGLELAGSGTITVNADLKVGTLAETITVTGETPVVDVQNAARQAVLTGEAVAAAPAARSWNGILLLQPGITGDPGQVQLAPSMIIFGGHGGPTQEGRLLVDGMNVGASRGGGGVSGYMVDTGNLQEVTFRSSGGLGEAETGGPYMNVIPKTGGNTFHGSFVESFSNQSLQASNYTDALKAAGLRVPGELLKLYDHDAALGGPIMKDRLWFYSIVRYLGNAQSVPGMYANANAGNPNAWTYVPDTALQARSDSSNRTASMRITYQISQRNKLNLFWDEQRGCNGSAWIGVTGTGACRDNPDGWIEAGAGSSATLAPETAIYSHGPPANSAGDVDLADLEQGAARCRDQRLRRALGRQFVPGKPDARLHPGPGAGRKHSRSVLSSGQPALWRHVPRLDRLDHGEHLARAPLVCHRLAQLQGRIQRPLRQRQPAVELRQLPGARVSVQQRRAESVLGALRHVRQPVANQVRRLFRAGPVDVEQVDAAGRAPLRPRVQLLPAVAHRRHAVHSGRDDHPANRRRRFQGPHAESRRRLRPVRQREDVVESELGQVPVSGAERRDLHRRRSDDRDRDEHDAVVDRREQQLRGGLRRAEHRQPGPPRERGRFLRRPSRNKNFGTLNPGLTYSDQLLNGLRPWDTQIGVAVQQQLLRPRVGRGAVQQALVRRPVRHAQPRRAAVGLDASTTSRRPSDSRLPGGGGYPVNGLYDIDPDLFGQVNYQVQAAANYGDALPVLGRRRRELQRHGRPWPHLPGRHQHRTNRAGFL